VRIKRISWKKLSHKRPLHSCVGLQATIRCSGVRLRRLPVSQRQLPNTGCRTLLRQAIASDLASALNGGQKPCDPHRFNRFRSSSKLTGNVARCATLYACRQGPPVTQLRTVAVCCKEPMFLRSRTTTLGVLRSSDSQVARPSQSDFTEQAVALESSSLLLSEMGLAALIGFARRNHTNLILALKSSN
jgi:hypothetical protein